MVEILDTAGTEQFLALKELYIRSGQGFILAFSLTSLASVNELGALREAIVRIKDTTDIALVLVGNKSDLKPDRQVPREIGTSLSKAWGNVPYYEASARRRVNVDEVFADVVRQVRAKEGEGRPGTAGSGRAKEGSGSSFGKLQRDRKKCVVM